MDLLFDQCKIRQKPVFVYDEAYLKFGATLVVSADLQTIGRQAATLVKTIMLRQEISTKVQPPAGTQIILNNKKVKECHLEFNESAMDSINTIVEE